MTFQVTIMFGLSFVSVLATISNLFGYFYYDRLIGISSLGFLAAKFKLEF